MMDGVRVWKFEREKEPGNPLILDEKNLESLVDELRSSDDGDCYTIHVEYMSAEVFSNLPEWDGW